MKLFMVREEYVKEAKRYYGILGSDPGYNRKFISEDLNEFRGSSTHLVMSGREYRLKGLETAKDRC